MKPEDKQALIEHIETALDLLRNVTLKHCHEVERDCVLRDIKVNEIALAALTAQPVKLPPRRSMLTREEIDQDYVTCMAISVEDAIAAIRAAGYEVQE